MTNCIRFILVSLLFSSFCLADDFYNADQIFKEHQVQNLEKMALTRRTIDDSFCGGSIYFISLSYAGKYQGEDYAIELLLETLTQEQYEKIFTALQENYASKGLPECLKQDLFGQPSVNYVLKYASYQPKNIPADKECGQLKTLRPLTSCILVDKIYD